MMCTKYKDLKYKTKTKGLKKFFTQKGQKILLGTNIYDFLIRMKDDLTRISG